MPAKPAPARDLELRVTAWVDKLLCYAWPLGCHIARLDIPFIGSPCIVKALSTPSHQKWCKEGSSGSDN
jgi:hypothetical protein